MSLVHSERLHTYKPGSIYRIKLSNFLTYENVEFVVGPRLNMVIGPNGTGKSTILCAMCLGLGGEPKLLGRADDARTFIMHEKQIATIEIELIPVESGDNHILKRIIDRSKGSEHGKGKGSSTYYINNTKTNIKEIQKLVSEVYNISIDNLCTFLPQDRVGSFSGFDSKMLLAETEKSLSSSQHLYETHQQLIKNEEDLLSGNTDSKHIEERLSKLQAENARLEREKLRMEERQIALAQKELLEKKVLWLKFDNARTKAVELKESKNSIKQELKACKSELMPLEENHSNIQKQLKRIESKFIQYDKDAKSADREMSKHSNKAETHIDEIDVVLNNLRNVDAEHRKALRTIEALQKKVVDLEQDPTNQIDADVIVQNVSESKKEFDVIKPQFKKCVRELNRLLEQSKDIDIQIRQSTEKLNRMNDEKARRRDRIFRSNTKLFEVSQWIGKNRTKFRRPVTGPIAAEISTKSNNAAAMLEFHVPNHTLNSFIVECQEDYQFLYSEVRQKLNLPINIIEVRNGKLKDFNRKYSDEKMAILKNDHGIMGYMDESFTAPDCVVQALIDHAQVNKVLIGNDKTQESLDRHDLLEYLCESEQGDGRKQSSVIFASSGDKSFNYRGIPSRFDGKLSQGVDEIPQARMLAPGVAPAVKQAEEEKLKGLQNDQNQLHPMIKETQTTHDDLQKNGQLAKKRLDEAKRQKDNYDKFHQRLKQAQRKLQMHKDSIGNDDNARKKEKSKLIRQFMARVKSGVSAIEAHSDSHCAMMKHTYSSAGARINQDGLAAAERVARTVLSEKKSAFEDITAKFNDVSQQFNQAKAEMTQLKAEADEGAPLRDEDGNDLPLKQQLDDLAEETLEEVESSLEEVTAKVNGVDFNPDVIQQYEARKEEIEEVTAQLEAAKDAKEAKLTQLKKDREPWEAALRNAVDKVNLLFGKYMEELGCAGQVQLATGEGPGANRNSNRNSNDDELEYTGNFKNWGIEILVKFREKSKLQVLSAQVQSGGERSVSTIMYLMALQELMVSPFRCVDEINQGLDERNERLVFKRIVENSTRPPRKVDDPTSHSGQYFLITPKLLPNMTDMENDDVTVLVIFNGQYNFRNPLDWNVKRLLEIADSSKCSQDATSDDEVVIEELEDEEHENKDTATEIPRKKKQKR